MRVIPVRELRNRNAEIIEEVSRGETFLVTRRGDPVAELRPVTKGRRSVVAKAEVIRLAERSTRVDFGTLRRDLDSAVDPGLT